MSHMYTVKVAAVEPAKSVPKTAVRALSKAAAEEGFAKAFPDEEPDLRAIQLALEDAHPEAEDWKDKEWSGEQLASFSLRLLDAMQGYKGPVSKLRLAMEKPVPAAGWIIWGVTRVKSTLTLYVPAALIGKKHPKSFDSAAFSDEAWADEPQAGASAGARDAKLEAAILKAKPGDLTPFLAYADWLTERGDTRGELISCEVKAMQEWLRTPGKHSPAYKKLAARAQVLWPTVLGALAPCAKTKDNGFINSATVWNQPLATLKALFEHPAALLMSSLELKVSDGDAQPFVDTLAAHGGRLESLRLTLGVPADLTKLWPALKKLTALTVDAAKGSKLGKVPKLDAA
jgi:uncharacterized protein (TIGR02996 family)